MKISRFHDQLAKTFPECIDHPEKYIGPNYRSVLNFWIWLENNFDSLNFKSYKEGSNTDWVIQTAAENAVGHLYQLEVFNVVYQRAYGSRSFRTAASWAVLEILAAHELHKKDYDFCYLKQFQNYENP